jgi:D-arabinose 1-dehydrogenase-like Zn-dependent alcohol dehydrogenase
MVRDISFLTKEILARTGTIVPLTAEGAKPMTLPSLSMLFNGYNVHSSLVASRKVHDDMLRFAALHGIRPVVEEFSMDEEGWGKALERLHTGKVRYRAVLSNE